MRTVHHNFREESRWKRYTALVPVALAPLLLIGFSLRPAVEYVALTGELTSARQRAFESDDLERFLASFGDAGPPTEQYEALLALLSRRVPHEFEPTAFLERCMRAAEGIDMSLGAITPVGSTSLDAPVDDLVLHKRTVSLQGRSTLADLTRFFSALHRQGQPVGVLQSKLDALEDGARFDFTVELAVFYLDEPADASDDDSLFPDDLPDEF